MDRADRYAGSSLGPVSYEGGARCWCPEAKKVHARPCSLHSAHRKGAGSWPKNACRSPRMENSQCQEPVSPNRDVSRSGTISLEQEETGDCRAIRSAAFVNVECLAFGVVGGHTDTGRRRLSAGQSYCGWERLGFRLVGEFVILY